MMSLAKTVTRRELFSSTAALISVAALGSAIPAFGGEGKLPFLAIGDWGRGGDDAQRDVAIQMAQVAREIAPRFVLSLGDNFYSKDLASIADPQWQTNFEAVYDDPSLRCPWYVVLGNHDYNGSPEVEIKYSSVSPRWRQPARYYRHTEAIPGGGTADFFFLDTTPIVEQHDYGQNVDIQLAWLESELAASTAKWKIAVGHHPVLSGGHHGSFDVMIERLKPLLERYSVRVYFNGHDHDLQHISVDGIHYLTSGAGAQTRPTGAIDGTIFSAAQLGFIAAMLGPEAMAVAFVNDSGEMLHVASIPVESGAW
jgi:acid phosphatase